jgi:DNA polymerase III delta subunit
MIIFLYGEDSYRRHQKLKELIAAYRAKHKDIDFLQIDLAETPADWLKAKDFLVQPSMFVDSKILVVKESGSVDEKDWRKVLKAELANAKVFILISDAKKPAKPFDFLLKPPAQAQLFEELTGEALGSFLKKEAAKRGLVFAPEAWHFFTNYVSKQSERGWFSAGELQKIALANFQAPISLVALQKAVRPAVGDFSFLKAKNLFFERTPGRRLFWLEDLILTKEEPAYLFNLLAYQAQGRDLGRFADYDVSIKSGGLEYEEALLAFILG